MSAKRIVVLAVALLTGCSINSSKPTNPLPPASEVKSITVKLQPGYEKIVAKPEQIPTLLAIFDKSTEVFVHSTWDIAGEMWIGLDNQVVTVTIYMTGYRQMATYSVNGKYYNAESPYKLDQISTNIGGK